MWIREEWRNSEGRRGGSWKACALWALTERFSYCRRSLASGTGRARDAGRTDWTWVTGRRRRGTDAQRALSNGPRRSGLSFTGRTSRARDVSWAVAGVGRRVSDRRGPWKARAEGALGAGSLSEVDSRSRSAWRTDASRRACEGG